LRQGAILDATIIRAPNSTNNKEGKRDPEMHQAKKGSQYFLGMQAYVGADADSGLPHHVHGTASNVGDVTEVAQFLHGNENIVCADASYTGVEKRSGHGGRQVIWQIADHRSTYKHLSKRGV
jgi:IS5 family transposase